MLGVTVRGGPNSSVENGATRTLSGFSSLSLSLSMRGSPRRKSAQLRPTIRAARTADAEAMRSIYNEAVRHTTATFDTKARSLPDQIAWLAGHDRRHPVLVAELAGRVVGWVSLSPWSDRHAYDGTAEISVYVGGTWRRHGIGRKLVTAVLRAAVRSRFHMVLARVAEGNPVSRTLHIRAGFTPVGVMHEVGYKFGRLLNVELMERRIDPPS
jgi:L-amino acid N-acyltransferase